MAVVVLLLVCGWISIINAQPDNITATLSPQAGQSVCPGESISYNCIGNGTDIELFSPPIIPESNPVTLFSNQGVQANSVIPNIASAIILVDPTESSLFIVTFTLYISDEQSEGERTVFCRVIAADGMATSETTFSVLGIPSPAASINFEVLASSSEEMTQVPVNVSWDSPENAREFMLQIMNTNFNNTIRSLESSITTFLPYGTYSATLCTINRCGNTCRDYPNIFSAEPQLPRPKDNSLLIAAVIAGVLGFLLILASIYGVAVTMIICKKDKINARAIAANEAKEMQMD